MKNSLGSHPFTQGGLHAGLNLGSIAVNDILIDIFEFHVLSSSLIDSFLHGQAGPAGCRTGLR
jgi:hypothetical protein